MSTFAEISKLFENVRTCRLAKHEINSQPVSRVIEISSQMFRCLEKESQIQNEVLRQLWVIRSTILNTVLDFNHPALQMDARMEHLRESSSGLPELEKFLPSFQEALDRLLTTGLNPKKELLARLLGELPEIDKICTGIFCVLSAGKPPGWPDEAFEMLTNLSSKLAVIRSGRDLDNSFLDRIILPCGGRNVPFALMERLVHSGHSRRIEVLLYSNEEFRIPKRLPLVDSPIFKGKIRKTVWENDSHEVHGGSADAALDEWADEAFWQGLHNGVRARAGNLVPAHYVLFQDGTGTFLPQAKKVFVLPKSGVVTDEIELRSVHVDSLSDTDLLVLKAGDSDFLLDEASGHIMSKSGEGNLLDKATDWKDALDALLVTHSHWEVTKELEKRDVNVTPLSIHQWAGSEILGPRDERTFKELIGVLYDKGKLSSGMQDQADYARTRWRYLQELRAVRQRAGTIVRQNLVRKLLANPNVANGQFGKRTSVSLEADGNLELLILRVHSIDPIPAYVQSSRLCRIEDLGSNKWLE